MTHTCCSVTHAEFIQGTETGCNKVPVKFLSFCFHAESLEGEKTRQAIKMLINISKTEATVQAARAGGRGDVT